MKMNEFLKQIASDKRKLGKELNKDDYYLMLKYTGINKDQSLSAKKVLKKSIRGKI